MKYSPEILEDIMLDAKHGLSLQEVALRLNITFKELYTNYCNPELEVKSYYDAGQSLGKIETDKALYELAKNGSSTAKKDYDDKLSDATLSNQFNEIFNS